MPWNIAGIILEKSRAQCSMRIGTAGTRGCLLMCTWFRRATVSRHRPTSPSLWYTDTVVPTHTSSGLPDTCDGARDVMLSTGFNPEIPVKYTGYNRIFENLEIGMNVNPIRNDYRITILSRMDLSSNTWVLECNITI